jgi:hypothetical protein
MGVRDDVKTIKTIKTIMANELLDRDPGRGRPTPTGSKLKGHDDVQPS